MIYIFMHPLDFKVLNKMREHYLKATSIGLCSITSRDEGVCETACLRNGVTPGLGWAKYLLAPQPFGCVLPTQSKLDGVCPHTVWNYFVSVTWEWNNNKHISNKQYKATRV